MFSTLMVTFREGVEAFLVVAVTLMYLKKTRRVHLIAPMRLAVVVAVIGSVLFGAILARIGALSPTTEGWLALAAFALVASCTVHMLKNGKQIASQIRARIERADTSSPAAAKVAVFLFVLLMIGREGIETATMLASLASTNNSRELLIGGLLGTCGAALLSLAWVVHGPKINLATFFNVSALFMLLFSIQLAIYAFHEFTEGGSVPLIDNARWHILTEPFGPEGLYGAWLTYSLGIAPLVYLSFSKLAPKLRSKRAWQR